MSAQLDQILGYLDREGVTEVVIGVGRPISIRRAGELVALTAQQLTRTQVISLIQHTPIAQAIPEGDGTGTSTEVTIGARRIKVQAGRRGDELLLRLERAPESLELELEPPQPLRRPSAAVPMSHDTAPRAAMRPPAEVRAPASEPRAPQPEARSPAARTAPVAAHTASSSHGPRGFAELVRAAQELGASDLHIATGRVTSVRVLGELIPLDASSPPLSPLEADALLLPLLGPEHQAQLARVGYVDLAIASPTGGRLRSNLARHQGGLKGTFRIARAQPATLDELGLPRELAKVVAHHQGLVVIAGPSGHGKTTTLAALVDLINASRPFHIVTIEDPVEIVYPKKAAVVSQREVGPNTNSFAAALKGSLRQDPDVIVIGELRDRETVEIALTASETGHLVLATMSTPSAAKTIDRLVDMFPPEDQSQVRASIAGALRAIVAQRLLPSAGNDGVVAAVELLTGVLPLAVMIRDDKLYQLPNLMQRGRAFGMIRFDDSLTELVRAGKITVDAALAAPENKRELASTLRPGGPPVGAAPRAAEPAAPAAARKGGLGALFGKKDRE